jgi:hypothetical protein
MYAELVTAEGILGVDAARRMAEEHGLGLGSGRVGGGGGKRDDAVGGGGANEGKEGGSERYSGDYDEDYDDDDDANDDDDGLDEGGWHYVSLVTSPFFLYSFAHPPSGNERGEAMHGG